jgi:hypothetical protein
MYPIMKNRALLFLACLLLILPVTGYTVPHIQTVFQCSNDIYGDPDHGAIIFESTPPGAWVIIDGIPRGVTPWTEIYYKGENRTVTFTFPHSSAYYDYNASFMTCKNKYTYVKATLVPITTTVPTTVPTTAGPVRAIITFAQATTTPVTGTTTAVPTTTVTAVPGVTTQVMEQVTQQASALVGSGSAAQPDTLGSLSVTTNPAGAFIFIDGVQRGVTPATIPGLSAGTHTLILKLDGYQDISTPVTIVAGKTQDYSSGMAKNAAAAPAVLETANATASSKKTPGFECVYAFAGLGGLFLIRKRDTE